MKPYSFNRAVLNRSVFYTLNAKVRVENSIFELKNFLFACNIYG